MDDASDGELLERARQGHADAFSTLVRRHDRYLYRVARSVLRDDDEAEDVVQQTYLQAYINAIGNLGLAAAAKLYLFCGAWSLRGLVLHAVRSLNEEY
jgi:RNA polymerase sigma-70 factor (ECF subfamily)